LRIVLVELPAGQALGPVVGGLPGAVAVVEGAAEVDFAVASLVDAGVHLGPRRLTLLRRDDLVHVHDALQDLAPRIPAIQEAAGVAARVVAVVADAAVDA